MTSSELRRQRLTFEDSGESEQSARRMNDHAWKYDTDLSVTSISPRHFLLLV